MTKLAVWGIVLPLLVIAWSLPVGVDLSWAPGVVRRRERIWFVPLPPRKKKEKKHRDRPAEDALQVLLKNGYTTLCRLASRGRMERLSLHVTAAGPDPAAAALLYGAAGVALEGLSSALAGRVKHLSLQAEADFEAALPSVSGQIVLSMSLGRLWMVWLRFRLGVLRDRYEQKQRETI